MRKKNILIELPRSKGKEGEGEMSNIERIYYMLQENDCGHWFRDNADTLRLAEYLDKKGCIAPPCEAEQFLRTPQNDEVRE